tara:strand:- start:915 stop:1112 length:198 start_codon:yes stop_codon:yes gene_type:complete
MANGAAGAGEPSPGGSVKLVLVSRPRSSFSFQKANGPYCSLSYWLRHQVKLVSFLALVFLSLFVS